MQWFQLELRGRNVNDLGKIVRITTKGWEPLA